MNFVTLFGGMPSAAASVHGAVYPEGRSRGRAASEPPLVHVLQEGLGKIVGAGLGQQGVGVAMGAERRAASGVVEVGTDFGGGENPLAGEATAEFGLTDEGFVSDGIFVGILQYGFLQLAAGGTVGELADELLGNQAAEGLGSRFGEVMAGEEHAGRTAQIAPDVGKIFVAKQFVGMAHEAVDVLFVGFGQLPPGIFEGLVGAYHLGESGRQTVLGLQLGQLDGGQVTGIDDKTLHALGEEGQETAQGATDDHTDGFLPDGAAYLLEGDAAVVLVVIHAEERAALGQVLL